MTLFLVLIIGILIGMLIGPFLRRVLVGILYWYIDWNTARLYRKDPERADAWVAGVYRGMYGGDR